MKRIKQEPPNPYQRGVSTNFPPLFLPTGQYVSVALGLEILPQIQPEAGDNVYAMWLRAFAERGTLWDSLSGKEKQEIALDLYFACYQRAVSLGPDSFAKYTIPFLSEDEFETILQSLQKRCGFKEPRGAAPP